MSSAFRKFCLISAAFLVLWLGLRYLLPLVFPFLLGAVLALIAEPMTGFFCKKCRMPRALAAGIGVSMTFCFLFMLALILGALVVRELGVLAGVLPDLEQTASAGIAALSGWLQGLTRFAPDGLRGYLSQNIGDFFSSGTALLDKTVKYLLSLASGILSHVPDSAFSLGTAVVASFMISAKLPKIRSTVSGWIPRERFRGLFDALKRVKSALGGWLLAQVKLSGVTFGILAVGFLILRIHYGPLWAFVVALVDAFPVLGTGTVLIPWAVVCFLQGSNARAVGLLGVYAVVALTRSALEPKLVGKQLGLDPLATLFALYAGYKIWGLGGMIIAPILSVAVMQLVPGTSGSDKL